MAQKPHKGPHKYIRVKKSDNNVIWKCALEKCFHYISDWLVAGKETICHRCLQIMLMDKPAMRREKPICEGCKEIVYGQRRYDLVNRKYGNRYNRTDDQKAAVGKLFDKMELDLAKNK